MLSPDQIKNLLDSVKRCTQNRNELDGKLSPSDWKWIIFRWIATPIVQRLWAAFMTRHAIAAAQCGCKITFCSYTRTRVMRYQTLSCIHIISTININTAIAEQDVTSKLIKW